MQLTEDKERITERVAAMEERRGVQPQEGQAQQQHFWQGQRDEVAQHLPVGDKNVGSNERAVSIASGAILGILGLRRATVGGLITAGIGTMLIYRGVTGRCMVYRKLGLNTAQPEGQNADVREGQGIEINTAMTINKPQEELYRYWRNFENLPQFMKHLEAVRVIDDRRSHWVVQAPRLAGGNAEWDAEITKDEPNEVIAWRSLPGSTVDTAGEVRFRKALGDRGTEVHVWMNYTPPGGMLGHWAMSLLGTNPKRMVREELRRFKSLMEIGEVATIIGQPHGTCKGTGEKYNESGWTP